MDIEVKTSNEMNVTYWQSYTYSFNEVFIKDFAIKDFKHKYINTIDGFSYHVLLKSDNKVVGGFTVIPYEYYLNEALIRVGLTVDVFITEDHRSDLMALYKMYKNIKKEMILRDISIIITNPNDTAYLYWKKLVRFIDVGHLNYYALPVKIANVILRLPKVFNIFSFYH